MLFLYGNIYLVYFPVVLFTCCPRTATFIASYTENNNRRKISVLVVDQNISQHGLIRSLICIIYFHKTLTEIVYNNHCYYTFNKGVCGRAGAMVTC